MTDCPTAGPTYQSWPSFWRMVVVALSTLVLCSCRGPGQPRSVWSGPGGGQPCLSQQALSGVAEESVGGLGYPIAAGPEAAAIGLPMAQAPVGPWAPPGIRRPWPRDEYLADGGDSGFPAKVQPDWEVRGVEPEDTVAHFDTLDGRTLVEPTNRVYIYSPRFGTVRQVVSLVQNEQMNRLADVHLPTRLARHEEVLKARAGTQNLQAGYQLGTRLAASCRTTQGDGALSSALGPEAFQDTFLPFEDMSVIRLGVLDEAEAAWLAQSVTAPIAWTHKQAVQIQINHQAAVEETTAERVQSVFTVKEPPGDPKLRIVKVASTQFAEPGDVVDFTIRFDNVGNQLIGNVTIIDNLSPRLAYVPHSAQCSIPAKFLTEQNDGGSLAVRCEITDPLPVGKGGIFRFRCRVR